MADSPFSLIDDEPFELLQSQSQFSADSIHCPQDACDSTITSVSPVSSHVVDTNTPMIESSSSSSIDLSVGSPFEQNSSPFSQENFDDEICYQTSPSSSSSSVFGEPESPVCLPPLHEINRTIFIIQCMIAEVIDDLEKYTVLCNLLQDFQLLQSHALGVTSSHY